MPSQENQGYVLFFISPKGEVISDKQTLENVAVGEQKKLSFELLPKYNLATWRSYLKTEQGGAIAALFANHFISSKSEIWYQCATVNTAYFRLRDGSRYVAYLAGDIWIAEKVSSDIEAKNYFLNKTGTDYSFIILDD